MAKPKANIVRMREVELDHLAETVLEKMSDNPYYSDPNPPLDQLNEALKNYRKTIADATRGGKLSTIQKGKAREQLERMLRKLVLHVEIVSQGDPARILSAGFDHDKNKGRVEACPAPERFRMINGPVGSCWIKLSVRWIRAARLYRFEYRLAGSTDEWTEQVTHAL